MMKVTQLTDRQVYDLFVLNIALQIFDGVATYQGLTAGWREANPVIAGVFEQLGIGPTLLLFKAMAGGLLVLLNQHRYNFLVAPGLSALAGTYFVFSLVPWSIKLVQAYT